MTELPLARVEPESRGSWTRLLPLAALLLALFLVRSAWLERGPLAVLRAADGHGIAAGDPVRYRGIEVGSVEAVELGRGAREVVLRLRLARSAGELLRAGTRFWVARPVLGVEGVSGLETALGARYVALLPGPSEAREQREFTALSEPPLSEAEDPGALEVVLLASARDGLVRGAPVLYRGIPIGVLVSVGLASDAVAVEARARIQAAQAELVRVDSRFYRTRGAELSLGLGGLELAVDSLQSLWLGGVALATPTHPGARAATGARFELAAEPEDEWRDWRPALPVGSVLGAGELVPPALVWARLSWRPRGWFARQRERSGWLVREEGALLGPADLLVAPPEAEQVVLELAGRRLELTGPPEWSAGELARRAFASDGPAPLAGPAGGLTAPEDLLLCADPALAPMAVAAAHLAPAGGEPGGWRVAPALAFDERWHGSVAVARADGRWVGILLVEDGEGRIVPLPPP
jgi:paraquat-inducible protein B